MELSASWSLPAALSLSKGAVPVVREDWANRDGIVSVQHVFCIRPAGQRADGWIGIDWSEEMDFSVCTD